MATNVKDRQHVRRSTPDQGVAMLDEQARRHLDMSGDDFLRDWDAGVFADRLEDPSVMAVAAMIPFARPPKERHVRKPNPLDVALARIRRTIRDLVD